MAASLEREFRGTLDSPSHHSSCANPKFQWPQAVSPPESSLPSLVEAFPFLAGTPLPHMSSSLHLPPGQGLPQQSHTEQVASAPRGRGGTLEDILLCAGVLDIPDQDLTEFLEEWSTVPPSSLVASNSIPPSRTTHMLTQHAAYSQQGEAASKLRLGRGLSNEGEGSSTAFLGSQSVTSQRSLGSPSSTSAAVHSTPTGHPLPLTYSRPRILTEQRQRSQPRMLTEQRQRSWTNPGVKQTAGDGSNLRLPLETVRLREQQLKVEEGLGAASAGSFLHLPFPFKEPAASPNVSAPVPEFKGFPGKLQRVRKADSMDACTDLVGIAEPTVVGTEHKHGGQRRRSHGECYGDLVGALGPLQREDTMGDDEEVGSETEGKGILRRSIVEKRRRRRVRLAMVKLRAITGSRGDQAELLEDASSMLLKLQKEFTRRKTLF